MVNINLTTSGESVKSEAIFKKSINYVILIVVAWCLIYGGIIFYRSNVEKQITEISIEQLDKNKQIKEGGNKDIFDFQTRLATAKTLVDKKEVILDNLSKIQGLIVDGVYLTSYEYIDGRIMLSGKANGYDFASRQILNLKKSDFFSSVDTTAINVAEDGKISFALALITK